MKLKDLNPPTNPGCYIYKDKDGKVIYVGKAKNLKKRVSSYFNKKDHDIKTEHLVSNISNAEFIVTDNEVEALILENSLIKKYQPKYNMMLKDSKRYAYIGITNEEYPRILTIRNKNTKNIKYLFGPYTDGTKRRIIVDLLKSIFFIRTCNQIPKKVCMKYHLGLCKGPCEGLISKEDYLKNVRHAIEIIKGNTDEIISYYKKEMDKLAKEQNFEAAKEIRDKIAALEYLSQSQKVETNKKYNQDIINYKVSVTIDKKEKEEKANFLIFNVDKGTIINKQDFSFDVIGDDILDQFVKQYYSINEIPKEIILPHHLLDENKIKEYLESLCGFNIEITVPKIGEKLALLKLVEKNIDVTFGERTNVLFELMQELKLPKIPTVIECFDISNLGSTNVCASMVQFRDGKPDKSNYRKFKIRTVVGQDDFASMREVIFRRYSKVENFQNDKFPDLVIVDGGLGQLNAAREVFDRLQINIPLISIAKREELVFGLHLENFGPIAINHKKESLKLLQRIRDEAHRFVINYQKKLRQKDMFD